MLWMEAEIVQMFVPILLLKGDMTSLPLKAWPPEKFWHTAITLPATTQENKSMDFSVCFFLRIFLSKNL